MNERKRVKSFDLFRGYGCLAIVMLHVVSAWKDDSLYGYTFLNTDIVRTLFNNVIVPLLVRMAVPIFFMISGVLFLDPQNEVSTITIKRHIIKILVILGTFGYGMALVELVATSGSFKPEFLYISFLNLIQEQSWSHLWYLYATIGLYIITPILRSWIQGTTKEEMRILMLAGVLLLSVVPTINNLLNMTVTSFGIATPGGAVLCYITGIYLYSNKSRIAEKKKIAYVGATIGGGMMAIVNMLCRNWSQSMLEPFYIWTYLYSATLFGIMINSNMIEKMADKSAIKFLSKMSLAIYVIHPFFINALYKGLHFFPDRLPDIIGEITVWFIISVLTIISSLILKAIPGIRNYL